MTREEYLAKFSMDRRAKALDVALDIRKFEIELYWKRGTYFWTFTGATLAGYFAIEKDSSPSLLFTACCLGLIFSLAWYLVNRGSGAWQRNWEAHVDLLEDDVVGPLYKTVLSRPNNSFWRLAEPYAFSPSKINNLLSLSIVLFWVVLMVRALISGALSCPLDIYETAASSVVTLLAVVLLFVMGQTNKASEPIVAVSHTRTYL